MENKTDFEKKEETFSECARCKQRVYPKTIKITLMGEEKTMSRTNEVCSGCEIIVEAEQGYKKEQELFTARLEGSRMQKLHLHHTFENFKPEAGTRAAWKAMSTYDLSEKGFYIFGERSGIGKTHLMAALAQKLIRRGANALWVFCPDFLHQLRNRFDNRSVTYGGQEISIEQAKRVDALFIDDIGAEKPSDWVREVLTMIIDHRLNSQIPTFFTSNCEPDVLEDLLGERIVSRIFGGCDIADMDGTDHRKL